MYILREDLLPESTVLVDASLTHHLPRLACVLSSHSFPGQLGTSERFFSEELQCCACVRDIKTGRALRLDKRPSVRKHQIVYGLSHLCSLEDNTKRLMCTSFTNHSQQFPLRSICVWKVILFTALRLFGCLSVSGTCTRAPRNPTRTRISDYPKYPKILDILLQRRAEFLN